jgi:hypothetical protein
LCGDIIIPFVERMETTQIPDQLKCWGLDVGDVVEEAES